MNLDEDDILKLQRRAEYINLGAGAAIFQKAVAVIMKSKPSLDLEERSKQAKLLVESAAMATALKEMELKTHFSVRKLPITLTEMVEDPIGTVAYLAEHDLEILGDNDRGLEL